MHVYCYIYVRGKLVQQNDGVLEYVGGRSKGIRAYKGMSFEEFTSRILEKLTFPQSPGVSLTIVNMRNTCVSYHETYTRIFYTKRS